MISKEELHDMYWGQGMSMSQVAKIVGVSDRSICNWMKRYNIESRIILESHLKGAQKPSKEELERMYWEQGISQRKIAIEIGVSQATVNDWMNLYEIESRTNSESLLNGDFAGEKSGGWRGGISNGKYCYKFNNKFKEAVRIRDDYTCQLCGCEQLLGGTRLSIHHIHYDKENCYPDVVTLCRSCNSRVNTNRDYWEDFFETHLIVRGLLNWRIN